MNRKGDVLMTGFMNPESLALDANERAKVGFFSRSRNKLWKKAEAKPGHVLGVREMAWMRRGRAARALRRSGRGLAQGNGVVSSGDSESDGSAAVIAERTFATREV